MIKSLKKIRNNQDGVILITVVMLTIVLTIVALSLMGINITQVRTGQKVTDAIVKEQIAAGVFYRYYHDLSTGQAPTLSGTETVNGKTYSFTITNSPGTGPNGTDDITVQVN